MGHTAAPTLIADTDIRTSAASAYFLSDRKCNERHQQSCERGKDDHGDPEDHNVHVQINGKEISQYTYGNQGYAGYRIVSENG
jgi:hypothetical protein